MEKIPDEEYIKIIDLYLSGLSLGKISQMTNYTIPNLSNILKQNNIKLRQRGFSYDDAKRMYEMYQNNIKTDDIAKEFNTSRQVVVCVMKRNHFPVKSIKGTRKYNCDDKYFDKIDNQNKAYILGFLYADGCNIVEKGKIEMNLQERDKDILDSINLELKNERPLYFIKLDHKHDTWQNEYSLSIKSYHMSKVLNDLGMTPRKTKTLQFPIWLDDNLISHFVRGYFDGDGCLSVSDKNYSIEIKGSNNFIRTLHDVMLRFNIGSCIHKENEIEVVKTLSFTNKNSKNSFLNWIYKDAKLKLNRKYDKYKSLNIK